MPGLQSPAETVARTFARIAAHADPAVFISLRPEAEAVADARALADKSLPLYGVPVAIKDNIDVAGLPTTAACPAFAYQPERDAAAVERLKRAGAIVIGKTNLDQFATGLVGVRSPYGVPRNPFDPQLSPGGSSSGSAVAVAAGLVPLALGTDTAGSGRVPAGLNNIVGLKPSLGLVSTVGVVPACRSLDCVSLFALTTDDAFAALTAIAGPDDDGYSRALPLGAPGALPPVLRVAVPSAAGRIFFGDTRAAGFVRSLAQDSSALGARLVEIDFAPFLEAAQLLYEGPWVAERWAAVGAFIAATSRCRASGDARDHRDRRQAERGRYVPRVLPIGGTAPARARVLRRHRCADGADRARGLHDSRGRGRSGAAQQQSRHLHQLRQSARSRRPRGAGGDRGRRHAVRRHLPGAGRAGCAAREHRSHVSRRHRRCRSARCATRCLS